MTLNSPQFTKKNESFVCAQCGFSVPIAQQTCRDHCPKCLYSLHVDVYPGDRAALCGGLLKPVGYSLHAKKGILIEYSCVQCGQQRFNKYLEHDVYFVDDYDVLLGLSEKHSK